MKHVGCLYVKCMHKLMKHSSKFSGTTWLFRIYVNTRTNALFALQIG